ncbi:alpha/beta hydrolase [Sphingomonas sp. BK235]|uniref:alpha/beta fold hydrolase n=1 Tax=Sphingomonas sp. BK235 TaxID=2512131 RepID=UPI00104B1F27|nr:alpha/beta hydrolase [Sphingomonas sp. BK235]TCP36062.1 pimeloyl-ACP methyl ester carboxylesterase [Sphingomonas sp. BK235]
MEPTDDLERRDFIAAALTGGAMAALSPSAALARDASQLRQSSVSPKLGELKHVKTSVLDVGYFDLGAPTGQAVLLLHGWPYDVHTYVDVAPALAARGYRVIVPYLRGYGATRFTSNAILRNGQQAALASDAIELIEALGLRRSIVGGCDWGARSAVSVAACRSDLTKGLVSVSGYLIGSQEVGRKPLSPAAERDWWYQFYFATDRGREGYALQTREFARLIWKTASPRWAFDDDTFDQSAAALENPDHVAIAIHNYRWRMGLTEGESRYDAMERQLASFPPIRVPSITLEGDANGAPHPQPEAYRTKFQDKYLHRLVGGGVGHNLPQEAPHDFVEAVIDVDRMTSL